MFRYLAAVPMICVDDLHKARLFYGSTLGFEVQDSPKGEMLFVSLAGGTDAAGGITMMVNLVKSPDPSAAAIIQLLVDDIDQAIDELARAGVRLDTHIPRCAFCQDPAGNVLMLVGARA